MLVCSNDHGHPFGLPAPFDALARARSALGAARVTEVKIRNAAPDLVIRFDNGVVLELLVLSSGYECWETSDASGRCVTTNGNRDASTWRQKPRPLR
jgi:hypothetical protein